MTPALDALAARQHGRLARRQLLAGGVSASGVTRMQRRGWLRRVHSGVYATAGSPETREAAWMAAVLAGGEDARLSHRSCCELYAVIRCIDGPIHVTSTCGGKRRPGLVFHRARDLGAHTTVRNGIPATTIERALLDYAGDASPSGLRSAFEAADGRELVDFAVLLELCARGGGRKGSGQLAKMVLECAPSGLTRSPLERAFARFCARQGLPMPLLNVVVEGFEVDCFWPDHGLVVELDGYGSHRSKAQFERDRRRDSVLQLAGLRVFRVTRSRLRSDATRLAFELSSALGCG